MTLTVALNFEDGVTRFVPCRPGDTVADAAYAARINIPLDCRDGACGTCKCRVQSGAYDGGSYIEDALTDEEAAEGLALACQMRPKTDVVLDIFATTAACKAAGQTHTATLARVDRLSPTTIAFTLEGGLDFLPGQYVNIRVPGTDQHRSYSFSSAPGAPPAFLVRDIPSGLMSGFLRAAQPGTPVEFTGPSGSFYLREPRRPLLFLAGGTGLAPFLAMLGRLAQTGCAHPIRLVYGVTAAADLVCTDALDAYAAQLPGFRYTAVVGDYVMSRLTAADLNGGDADAYLCGPPPMVEAVRGWIAAQGVTPANFYTEKFTPAAGAQKQAA